MRRYCWCLLLLLLAGCGLANMPQNLSRAILNQPDPETVRDGAPAYLLLIDSMIEGDPDDAGLLSVGANLYGVYGDIFVADPQRSARLTERSWSYGRRALCASNGKLCGLESRPFAECQQALRQVGEDELEVFFAYSVSWLAWIKGHAGDWNALADLPKVEAALERMLQLDEDYQQGRLHLYLGILQTLRPPAFGGKPEQAREHFLRAIQLSRGRDLGVKVAFARHYARLLYDRALHDRLLEEVLAAEVAAPGLTLLNTLAQQDARLLLAAADEYF